MLADRGQKDLKEYWLKIGELQSTIIGPLFREKGFQGMFEYWDRIRREENCDMDLIVTEDYFELKMNVCPSLSKNLDNDAGLCSRYCDHCAGWVNPVVRNSGFIPVYDVVSRTEPRCRFRAYKSEKKAREFARNAHLLFDPYGDSQ